MVIKWIIVKVDRTFCTSGKALIQLVDPSC